uniref:(northern house mosquito) hypothetical protein n=2 Tax=Culex pipiens TaxID=7175 RepID=A0A8D8AXE4_CULPI
MAAGRRRRRTRDALQGRARRWRRRVMWTGLAGDADVLRRSISDRPIGDHDRGRGYARTSWVTALWLRGWVGPLQARHSSSDARHDSGRRNIHDDVPWLRSGYECSLRSGFKPGSPRGWSGSALRPSDVRHADGWHSRTFDT